MNAAFRFAAILLAGTGAMHAQGDLSELFSTLRKEGPAVSERSRQRTFEILSAYSPGGKSLAEEWPAINQALRDPNPFLRDQACAVLSSLMLLHMANPIALPNETKELVAHRLDEAAPQLRENAVRLLGLMAGGVPNELVPRLLQLVRADSASSVRRVVIGALASVSPSTPDITALWIELLAGKRIGISAGWF